ncbi:hypothetical protein [Desulforamulus aquiferis]|uniref:Uncharacterized protein n=1 Tax=Desulforamulus aquiferis TaxID=1397668 RepID=A0AAW7ZF74_9FIRM|nr:hypothetical protein [Desulforamulus aquiferis]MDO7787671.1 hypothetical protein [Desulforamulus aquiferis]RYD05955.1 hypothetical protein N752_06835 [Desulforamulus aquiferis]
MDVREQLYVDLMMLPEPDSCEAKKLIDEGYLTIQLQYTQKALDYIANFIESKTDELYQAINEAGPDTRRGEIMKRAGITQFGVFMDVANKMVQEGKLTKQSSKYLPVSSGEN